MEHERGWRAPFGEAIQDAARRGQDCVDTRLVHRSYRAPRAAVPYIVQKLSDELIKRSQCRDDGKVMVFEEFVLEALNEDL